MNHKKSKNFIYNHQIISSAYIFLLLNESLSNYQIKNENLLIFSPLLNVQIAIKISHDCK